MGDATGIEWTDATWNPIVGCSVVSPGCTHCYAMQVAGARLDGNPATPHYAGTTQRSKAGPVWTGRVALAPERTLLAPLRWRRLRRIFVNSMGDLFHESVPDEWIDRVFAVMALSPQHTFQVLTKRSKRMREYMASRTTADERGHPAEDIRVAMTTLAATPSRRDMAPALKAIPLGRYCQQIRWPLPNVWLGVSAEDQPRADERIPDLLATPAAIRFVSCEPLLGPIDLTWIPWSEDNDDNEDEWHHGVLDSLRGCGWIRGTDGWPGHPVMPNWRYADGSSGPRELIVDEKHTRPLLDWVIAGGESGPHARPMHSKWARSLRDQCAAAGTAFFFKQWGEWLPIATVGDGPRIQMKNHHFMDDGTIVRRVGKSVAGRLLDGREHNNMPAGDA